MCKQMLQGLLGKAPQTSAPAPARMMDNASGDTGAQVLDTSVGGNTSVSIGGTRKFSGKKKDRTNSGLVL